jgi:Uma2 family endonuclease
MQKRYSMPQPTHLVTAEQLERMPHDDYRYELVQGRLIRMSPVGAMHGAVTAALLTMLRQHAKARNLGAVWTEVGFKLAVNPDTVRAPDVAFVARDRIQRSGIPKGFWRGAPDLAVEVLSDDDRPSEVRSKIHEYLTHGVPVVLVIDPDANTLVVHRRLSPSLTLTIDDTLDLADIVDDFRCSVREIFEQ